MGVWAQRKLFTAPDTICSDLHFPLGTEALFHKYVLPVFLANSGNLGTAFSFSLIVPHVLFSIGYRITFTRNCSPFSQKSMGNNSLLMPSCAQTHINTAVSMGNNSLKNCRCAQTPRIHGEHFCQIRSCAQTLHTGRPAPPEMRPCTRGFTVITGTCKNMRPGAIMTSVS